MLNINPDDIKRSPEWVFDTAREAVISARCGGFVRSYLERGRPVTWEIQSTKGGWLAFYQIQIQGIETITRQCLAASTWK